ncbi:hypothetical protein AYK25_04415 [Thermoplasmatales archaeon SM1-50]|nr:MAG: hypothetical protein AYK25_04415 [Thermoplasmatales archaeon SM1-50]
MKKQILKIICTLVILTSLIVPSSAMLQSKNPVSLFTPSPDDFDPLVDNITVTVSIQEIRALDTIDLISDPDFFVQVTINDNEFVSDVWKNMKYVENPNWSASCEVPKDNEFVNITIALWDEDPVRNHLCDISQNGDGEFTQQYTIDIRYSIATGVWWGDDELGDVSGYGRLNGCDDNSIYQLDQDCELWFDITQNDFDGDGFPYWLETTIYNTSPLIDNLGEDADHDGVPIEWEYRFGLTYFEWGHNSGYYMEYDPFTWENHSIIDEDDDGLTNIEEYKTWQWGSDPFRQDIFLEIDQMDIGPNGEGSFVPIEAFDLLRDSYAKHNIVWHIDDGRLGGGEVFPFKNPYTEQDLSLWYWNYFMHNDANNWRRGVFHWAIITYNWSWAKGFVFQSQINGVRAIDCLLLSSKYHDSRVKNIPLIDSLIRKTFNSEKQRAIIYAGAIMHETGHTLNIRNPGVDNHNAVWPWQIGYWQYGPYKSVMNYRYIYTDLVDYSDGSRGKNDFDDWGSIDLTYFNPRPHW